MQHPLKRELSTSVSDLHLATVSNSIKKLKIHREGPQSPMPLTIRNPDKTNNGHANANLVTVMSQARDDFGQRYEIIKEVGKGGFSVVYQCRNRQTGVDYAVKVVDLRPLRLRERFNPMRLKREVEIMRRLHHPSIIQFIEVYEDPDHLMMVMEYCPGKELFDVILARKYLREEEARPIFAQIARALYYLHSLNIIHRDIKPENILIMDHVDPTTGQPVAKLLDFGLSKNAGRSEAKTFVGTPCYLAPEVEYTSKGLGGTYGLAADCWSLGAVLYVMLVARFPEFEADINGKVVVKLAPALWQNVSNEAKDLIRSLMNTNPNARMTMFGALQHPWLGQYRASEKELVSISVQNNDLSQELQEEAEIEDEEEERMMMDDSNAAGSQRPEEITAGGNVIRHQAMVIRQNDPRNHGSGTNGSNGQSFSPESLKLAPLLHLQRSIAACFEEAHAEYQDYPEVASQIRRGAVLCRHQLVESTKMLRKVEQTAKEVLEMFPDLELAIEEDEPKLAAEFFNIVKEWVVELRGQVNSTQKINKASMQQIQRVVEQSTVNLTESERNRSNQAAVVKQLMENLLAKIKAQATVNAQGQLDYNNISLDANSVLELFMSLFNANGSTATLALPKSTTTATVSGNIPIPRAGLLVDHSPVTGGVSGGYSSSSVSSVGYSPPKVNHETLFSSEKRENETMDVEPSSHVVDPPPAPTAQTEKEEQQRQEQKRREQQYSKKMEDIDEDLISLPPPAYLSTPPLHPVNEKSIPSPSLSTVAMEQHNKQFPQQKSSLSVDTTEQQQLTVSQPTKTEVSVRGSPRTPPASRLSEALHKLRQVDVILEQLGIFWANTEVVLDLLTKKGQHVEQFIGFSSKPRLMARFRERMEEYKRFWEGIRLMCSNYVTGVQVTNDQSKMYGFLEKNTSTGSSDSTFGFGGEGGSSSLGLDSSMGGLSGKGDSIDSLLNSPPFAFEAVGLGGGSGKTVESLESLKMKR